MKFISFILAATLTAGCGDTIVNYPSPTQPTNESTNTPKVVTIQFRVSGNAQSVRVRYSNERDGLVQTTTTLPFFTSFTSTASNLFLSLEVTPISFSAITDYPFLNAQIFVNGDLFREASSTSFFLNTISVDGTWRR
jgi:hypothetical protein